MVCGPFEIKKRRRGFASPAVTTLVFAMGQVSSYRHPTQRVGDGIRRLALGLGGDVCVGVQGEACRVVAQHAADRLNVHAVLQGQSGEGVAQVVEADVGQACPIQRPVEHTQDAVRGYGPAGGGRKDPGAIPRFLLLLRQNSYRTICQQQGAVAVFRFQRRLDDLPVDPGHLAADAEVAPLQVDVLPLETQQLAPAQAGGQLHIVHLIDAAFFGLPEEGCQLFLGQGFHLLALQSGQGTAVRRVVDDEPLPLGEVQRGGYDLVDITHCFRAKADGLLFGFQPLYPAVAQELAVEPLQIKNGESGERNVANVGLDVVVDVTPVGLVGGGADFEHGVVLKPDLHPLPQCVLPCPDDVQALGVLDDLP